MPGTNGGITTFKYDPFGRRIQKSGPLGTTNYLYDGIGENVIEEVDGNGNALARYAELALDEPYAELPSSRRPASAVSPFLPAYATARQLLRSRLEPFPEVGQPGSPIT